MTVSTGSMMNCIELKPLEAEELDAMNVRMPAPDEDEYYDKHHLWIDK